MASAQDFINTFPNYFDRELQSAADWSRIRSQAIEHTRFSAESQLLQINRPNEPQNVKDYRNAVRRRLTKSAVDKFKTKTARIFRSSGFSINQDSLSNALKDYLSQRNYRYLNQPTDLMTYFFEYVYNHAIDDPNAVEILLPYNPLNEDVPPFYEVEEGGVEKNKTIPIKQIIVASDQISAFTEDVFSWFGGYMTIKNDKDENVVHKWFWLVDNEWFYRYVPIKDTKDGVIYELREWYFHDTGIDDKKVLPVNIMMGNIVFDENDNFAYHSSILAPFFEYADEFVNRFSDGQAVWVNSAYPIHVMEEMTCTAEGCLNGYVKASGGATATCSTCLGTGNIQRPSPFGVMMKKANSGIDEKSSGKSYELINPDTEILKTTYEIPFEILKRGEKQIGLDVLENAVESGVSRAMRFEDVKDKLSEIAEKLVNFLELHLFYLDSLLNVKRDQRTISKVNTPVDFQLKSSIDLREDAENALTSDKLEKTLVYYRNIYKNNEALLQVYEYALEYAPSLIFEWSEVTDQFDRDILSENDLVKRNYAMIVFGEISQQKDWLKMSKEKAFALADEILAEQGLLKKDILTLRNDNGEELTDEQVQQSVNDLKNTVGGIQGIIALSQAVATGQMSEAAAEAILVNIYNIPSEIASTLIEVPIADKAIKDNETINKENGEEIN